MRGLRINNVRFSSSASRLFTELGFDSIPGLSENTLQSLRDFQFVTKTQHEAIPLAIKGKDVMIRAKTGHGKTLAFAIPLVEHLANSRGKMAVVVNPTRELALQTESIVRRLASAHGLTVQSVIGGTSVTAELKKLRSTPPDILIATPGRLLNHLESNSDLVNKCSFLCLDEADRLLDEGFERDMKKIFERLPRDRQTMLASATLPVNLNKYLHLALKADHQLVNVFSETGSAMNDQLEERVTTIGEARDSLSALLSVITDKKTIVFVQAAQTTALLALLFSSMDHMSGRVFQIHSRMTQPRRQKALAQFSASPNGILFSSDVGARGLDVDNVEHVVQFGMPADADTYVHRVGRTARAGRSGRALLMLFPWEESYFLDAVMPRLRGEHFKQQATSDPAHTMHVSRGVDKARRSELYTKLHPKGYQAMLGFHNSHRNHQKISAEQMVANVNGFAEVFGSAPGVTKKVIGKMGLKGVSGINIAAPVERASQFASTPQRRRRNKH